MKEKMGFENFKNFILAEVQARYGEDCEIREQEVMKNNSQLLHGIGILRKDSNTSPTFYVEGYHEMYNNGMPMDELLRRLFDTIDENISSTINLDLGWFRDFEKVKDKIVFRLINAAANKEFLTNVPYIPYLDLAVCFVVYYKDDRLGEGTIFIHNNHAEMWDVTAEQLYECAEKNSPILYPSMLVPMSSLISGLVGGCKMYVLTNKQKCMGASAVLYSEELKEFSDKCQTDIIMIPSSIHEWIVFPKSGSDSVDRILEMIEEVNRTCVEPEEVLSYRIYIYRAEMGQVRIAA